MRRFPVILAATIISLFALLSLSACGGGGSNTAKTNPVATVELSPTTGSVNVGSVALQFSPTAKDSGGNVLGSQTFTFTVVDPNNAANTTPVVSVAANGLVCAGTWDSLTAPVVCTPLPAANAVGTAAVTATSGGITSAPATVFVHKAVDNVTISPATPACVSQTGTLDFTAKAFSGGQDVTSTVGPIIWQAPLATVATVATKDNTTATVTAVGPGKTQVFANISGVQSTPAFFITCPIEQIHIRVSNGTATSVTLDKAATQALVADMLDSNNQPVANVTLNWSTSQPLVTPAAAGTLVGGTAGTSSITASCAPPTCNLGLTNANIYSNAFVANVNGTTATTVWVASTQGNSLVPIDTTTNAPGTAIALTDASSVAVNPNSMLISRQGNRMYLGSDSGLIVVDLTTNTAGKPFTSTPGKVLAVSPDGNIVIVSNTASSQVFVLTNNGTTSSTQTLSIAGAVSADFSPDGTKAYISGNGLLTIWSATTTPVPENVGGNANDATFLATGAFGYIGGTSVGVGVRAACNDAVITDVGVPGTPTLIRTLPDGVHLVAVNSPNISLITANSENKGCPPVVDNSVASTSLGGSFTARQLIVTPNGSKAFVTADVPGVLLGYDTEAKTSAPIQLGGGVTGTFTGGVTLDSTQLYVGVGGANAVHRIDLKTGLDATQIPMTFVPDLVAVQPK